jgi:small subunit ribosomal protein S20
MRTLIKKTLASTNKEEAEVLFKEASSFLDRVAAKRIIHKNKAAHQKARLAKHVNSL